MTSTTNVPAGNSEDLNSTDVTEASQVDVNTNIIEAEKLAEALQRFAETGEYTDENGDEAVATAEQRQAILEYIQGAVQSSDDTETSDEADSDDENLPPFELPAMYLDNNGRDSLSESKAYSEHLTEHWGF